MVSMTRLDAALVARWFDGVGESEGGWPTVGVELTGDELAEFDRGRQWVSTALAGDSPPRDGVAGSGPASTLLRYLHGLAGGIAGSRAVLRSVGVQPAFAPDHSVGQDAMCLVAGLLAGAAAVAGLPDPSAEFSPEPTVAQAAERAGVGAADRAVEGADLESVAGRPPASSWGAGWSSRLGADPTGTARWWRCCCWLWTGRPDCVRNPVRPPRAGPGPEKRPGPASSPR